MGVIGIFVDFPFIKLQILHYDKSLCEKFNDTHLQMIRIEHNDLLRWTVLYIQK